MTDSENLSKINGKILFQNKLHIKCLDVVCSLLSCYIYTASIESYIQLIVIPCDCIIICAIINHTICIQLISISTPAYTTIQANDILKIHGYLVSVQLFHKNVRKWLFANI